MAAPHMYGGHNAAALAAAAAAAGGHHGHVTGLAGHPSAAGFPTAQAHFVPADAGATAAYMQFPTSECRKGFFGSRFPYRSTFFCLVSVSVFFFFFNFSWCFFVF